METFLIKAAQLIVAFAILVTIHEFGHYILARIFGMRVDKFYMFFNPWFSLLKYWPDKGKIQLIAWTKKDAEDKEEPRALFTFKVGKPHPSANPDKSTWRDTLYGIGWLPLGGYCAINGMIDETTRKDQLAAEPKPYEFRAKKAVPRLLVMLGGVIFNFLLAIIIYIGIALYWGEKVVGFDQVTEGMDYAEQMHDIGLRDGDILLAVDGKVPDVRNESLQWDMIADGTRLTVLRNHVDTVTVTVPTDFVKRVMNNKSPLMTYRTPVVVLKTVTGEPAAQAGLLPGDRIVAVGNDTTPALTEFYPALQAQAGKKTELTYLRDGRLHRTECDVTDAGRIGIQLTSPVDIYPVQTIHYNVFTGAWRGITNGTDKLVTYVSSLKLLFSKEGAQSIGGFGAIGDMYPDQWNWYAFWNITAFLSVMLAFMNVLPIPALDGGHVIFTLWEIVARRKPSLKVLEYAQMAGMAFLLLLLVYANANDIYRFFIK